MLPQKQEVISVLIGYSRDMGDTESSNHDLYLRLCPIAMDPDRRWIGASLHVDGRFILTHELTKCELIFSYQKLSDNLTMLSPVIVLDDRFNTDVLSVAFEAMLRSTELHGDWIMLVHPNDEAARRMVVNSFFMNGYSSCGLTNLHAHGCAVYYWTKDPAKRGKNICVTEPQKVQLLDDIEIYRKWSGKPTCFSRGSVKVEVNDDSYSC